MWKGLKIAGGLWSFALVWVWLVNGVLAPAAPREAVCGTVGASWTLPVLCALFALATWGLVMTHSSEA